MRSCRPMMDERSKGALIGHNVETMLARPRCEVWLIRPSTEVIAWVGFGKGPRGSGRTCKADRIKSRGSGKFSHVPSADGRWSLSVHARAKKLRRSLGSLGAGCRHLWGRHVAMQNARGICGS